MDSLKEGFLKNEFLTMSVLGALGRSNTYSRFASEKEKAAFRIALREKLRDIGDRYISRMSEEEHLSNIKKIADDLTSDFSHCLENGRFRIGIAQKALNLYLKYLWCVGLIPMPPHCPFDSIIISHLPECKALSWTVLDSIDDYKKLVNSALKKTGGKSIAEWELEIWLKSVQTARERIVKKSGPDERTLKYFNNFHKKGVSYAPPMGSMPKKGDIFEGKINDLSQFDAEGWKRRDIWFFKHELDRREKFEYPARNDQITLIDKDGQRYQMNFSKPDLEDKVCLGTPSRLKSWYRKKGFDNKAVIQHDKVYFEYTGHGVKFIILTEQEYRSRQNG